MVWSDPLQVSVAGPLLSRPRAPTVPGPLLARRLDVCAALSDLRGMVLAAVGQVASSTSQSVCDELDRPSVRVRLALLKLSDSLARQARAGSEVGWTPVEALALLGDAEANGSLVFKLCGLRGGRQERGSGLLRSSSASDGGFCHGFLGFATRTIEPTRRVEPTIAKLIVAA